MSVEIIRSAPKSKRHAVLLCAAYRLRHEVFAEKLVWTAMRPLFIGDCGYEIDQFDTASTLHVVLEEDGEVVAYARLIQTTEPHVLTALWKLNPPFNYRGPHVYVISRYCATSDPCRSKIERALINIDMAYAMVSWGICNGVRKFLVEFASHDMRRLRRNGFKPQIIAADPGEDPVTAALLQCDLFILTRLP
jgi:N-acyl-L-homoserine lactone synthetase